jgi:hypothetical protein
LWLDVGTKLDEVYVKLFVPLPPSWQLPEFQHNLKATVEEAQAALLGFLRARPGFAEARLGHCGSLGVRDGGRIRGEYCLTAADVRQGRTFADAACRAAWPIEYWHPTEGVAIEYLPPDVTYEIPLRALQVRGLRNVFAAGKCLSADVLAHASARVVGTCWAMGEAVGKAAAQL